MSVARLEEQISFAEVVVPKVGRFGPIVRFVDGRDGAAGVKKENAKNTAVSN